MLKRPSVVAHNINMSNKMCVKIAINAQLK